jgi:signal transduction histidine kinase
VLVSWARRGRDLEVRVVDEGPGLPPTGNLFVPFFTTKPGGTGIGLVLSRQIAEAHGGSLTLRNRRQARGCEARLRLPLQGLAAAGQGRTGQ